jgi:hypothetical protein
MINIHRGESAPPMHSTKHSTTHPRLSNYSWARGARFPPCTGVSSAAPSDAADDGDRVSDNKVWVLEDGNDRPAGPYSRLGAA